ncbi:MAG TPA: ABC transporter ATP-binding protein [Caldisericia bacterium]|nr:MAG: putative ABC transporter ATP-binding protein [bacterium ADurb.Bin132]HNY61482.1 ABC transporter ATP-binding protein [Caldisericia bacterium]HOG70584.1 ABC transporter ATP-binding protein [Caldisericia bacterium]HPA65157.1 ABC transporter ATP-binding protein [Caldisericia bacterium]HQL68342.1 ABC transporter ATP-binding protein [Caldisericia bacterium]
MPEYIHEEEALGKAYDSRLIKRLLKYLKPYVGKTTLSLLMLIFWTALRLASPIIMKLALDKYISKGDIKGLGILMLAMFTLIIFQSIVRYYQILIMSFIGQYLMRDMRRQIFDKLQDIQMSFFDHNPVGRLITRITSDVDAIYEFLTQGIITLITDVTIVIGSTIMLFILQPTLALIAVSIMPPMMVAAVVFKNLATKFYREVRVKTAKVNAFLQESITGVRTIQWSGREDINKGMFAKISGELKGSQLKAVLNYTVFFQAIDLFETVATGFVVWYGSLLVLKVAITVGLLVAFTSYLKEFYASMYDISDHFNTMQEAMTSSERIFKLLDEPVVIKEKIDAIWPEEPINGHVEFQNVQLEYQPGQPVLKGVSFEVKPGQKVAVVGPTGAGKSSIISLLSRLYDIQGGDIKIDGHSIYDLKLGYLRSQISVVLQDPFIFSGPIIDNITLLSPISREKAREAARLVGAEDFILKLPEGYDYVLTERGATLSVGQRQLLSFARAIAHDPRILVLDEATSSIDTASETLIQEAMKNMMAGRTSIVVAHRLSTIKDADLVLVISDGKIAESGSHDELLKKGGMYKTLYELQFKAQERNS